MNKIVKYSRKKTSGWTDGEGITLSTVLILEAAEKLGIVWEVIPGTKIIKLTHQNNVQYFRYQIPSTTTDMGFYGCLDKNVTKCLLEREGIQVPNGYQILKEDAEEYWESVFESLSKPLVVKPSHGNQGNAITMAITQIDEFKEAVKNAFSFSNDPDCSVLVEETCAGNEYRILATKEKVIGVVYRMPANVVGDGRNTIEALIQEKNADPRRGDDTYPLHKIEIDEDLLQTLRKQNLGLESIVTNKERIFLRGVSNISKGGDSIDVTDEAHKSVKEIALKAINAIPGLAFAGIDFMTEDISKPQTNDSNNIIEVNSSPGFYIQELPYLGTPRDGKNEFLKLLFPELKKYDAT